MNSQNEWKEFFKNKGSVLLLFVIAMTGGTLYAIYLKQNHALDMEYVQNYLMDSTNGQDITMKGAFITFGFYFKKYAIIWFLGAISLVWPLAIGWAMLDVFEYAFSVASLYLTFGNRGLLMATKLFVVQGVFLTVMLLELVSVIIRKNRMFVSEGMKKYGIYLIIGTVGCGLIMAYEILLSLNK